MKEGKQIKIPKELADNLNVAIDNLEVALSGSPLKEQIKKELNVFTGYQNWYLEKQNKAIARDIYKLQRSAKND